MRQRQLRAIWLWGAVAVSILLLLASVVYQLYRPWDLVAFSFLFYQLYLGAENNLAATWSGLLLMLLAAHAFDGYARYAGRDLNAARGWAWIALVLLPLSADEIGSMHERVLDFASWLGILPFAVILGGMLGYGLVLLARSKTESAKVPYLLLGFFLLGTVAIHEFIEHKVIDSATPGAKALRLVLEEGSELGGMLILLRIVAGNTARLSATGGLDAGPAFEAVRRLRWVLAGVALALTPILAYLTVALEDNQGRLANWSAGLLFAAAALASCRSYFVDRAAMGWNRWIMGALCGLAFVAVTIHPGRMVGIGPLEAHLAPFVEGTIILLVCAISLLHTEVDIRRFGRIAASVSAALGGFVLLASMSGSLSSFVLYLLLQLGAVATFVVVTASTETQTEWLPYAFRTTRR